MPDGSKLVVKRLAPDGDWLTRATYDDGRLIRMWTSGLLDRIAAVADHTIVDVQRSSDVHVVMRDATADLLPPRVHVSHDRSNEILRGLASLHEAFAGSRHDGLCAIGARYAMFAPEFHTHDAGPGTHPLRERIVRGWELFARNAPDEVVEAVFGVHREPYRIDRRLSALPATLLHGDAKLENLGIGPRGLVAIDWGELTGIGPREIDVGWYALKGSVRTGRTPDELFGDYDLVAREPLDREALDLVCVGSLAQMGFRYAIGAYETGPEPPAVAAQQLEWWTARVSGAMDRMGSI
jgi:hypothetical protein